MIIVGVIFTISIEIIAAATRVPNKGEIWIKNLDLGLQNYKPFIKGHYRHNIKKVFPFAQPLEKFAPLMRVIMKYFTCEGRFSIFYKYHVIFIMHFTGVKPLNLAYYLYKSLAKMEEKV